MIIILFFIFYVLTFVYILPLILTSLKTRFNYYNFFINEVINLDNFLIFLKNFPTILKREKLFKVFGKNITLQTLFMIIKFSLTKKMK